MKLPIQLRVLKETDILECITLFHQNASLGFYGIKDYSGKGYMSTALKLVQKKIFEELALHRLEANIQPENTRSIHFEIFARFFTAFTLIFC